MEVIISYSEQFILIRNIDIYSFREIGTFSKNNQFYKICVIKTFYSTTVQIKGKPA